MCLLYDTFWKQAVEHDRLVIGAVIILRLVEEIESIDVFVIHLFANGTFWKHTVTHDILVMDAVIILTLVKEMK